MPVHRLTRRDNADAELGFTVFRFGDEAKARTTSPFKWKR